MKSFFRFCFVGLLSMPVFAQTNVSGTIAKDSEMTLIKSPYVVTGDLTVNSPYTLTIDSGVVLLFQSGTGLYVSGNIHARWASFTSSKDTSGGLPQRGDWSGIRTGYPGGGNTVFDTCQIKFGGADGIANLYIYAGNADIEGSTIASSNSNGLSIGTAAVTMNNSTLSNAVNVGLVLSEGTNINFGSSGISSCMWPVQYNGEASLIFNGINSLSGNTHNGIYMNFSYTTGGTLVLDTVSIPYFFPGDFTITGNTSMTVSPGDVLKFNSGAHLYVNQRLTAAGSSANNIYFTSYMDDNLGGDTNGDGTASAPAAGNWGGVFFSSGSDTLSIMRHCAVSFAGYGQLGGVTMNNASPVVDSCSFVKNYYGAMMQGVSNPKFTNNIIGSSQMVPIALSFSANPVFSNNAFSFSDNTYDAIGLLGGTLPANSILPIRSVTSIPNVTYLLLDQITVPLGITLTINKGIVIKAYQPSQIINIQGKLIANGTADSTIVFTSAKDDNFGNPHDSNKDGTATSPLVGDWGGIVFLPGSDSASSLNFCRLTYGELPWAENYNGTNYYQGEVSMFNASPTISNCSIGNAVYGIYAALSSYPKISNDTIFNTQFTPIAMSVSANPTFSGLKFVNTGWTALGILGEYVAATGEVKQRTVAGYSNITYVLLADVTINTGTNVIVDPGVVVKSKGAGIYVNGGFKAKGTLAAGNVVFTSLKDDNFGNPGDTNGDGASSSPSAGDWSTIRFQGTSDDSFCKLDSCTIKFGGNNSYAPNGDSRAWGLVTFTDAGGSLSNSILSDSYDFGIRCENNSTPSISSVSISNCKSDPIGMSLLANPAFAGITFAGNASKGIRILEGTLSSNATLSTRNIAGITNVGYIVDQLIVGSGAVLTIQPGVVIKFIFDWSYDYSISVQGALVADGTAAQPIVFTSMEDDSYGGDTNNDGNTSSPNKGNWCSIDFNASNIDNLNSMKHCVVRYGGYHWWYSTGQYYQYGNVRAFNCAAVVDSSTIEQSSTSAFGAFGSGHPTVTNTQMVNTAFTPVTISMFASPSFSGITALNVGYMAIGIIPETYSVNGTVPIRSLASYSDITYLLYGTCTINTGTTITIPAGVVFKGGAWQVNGALAVNGTASQPVVFTDPADDSYGNPFDTNQDGSATTPTIQSGNRINVAQVSTDSLCVLKHAVLRFTDGGINLQQSSPTITGCTFDRTNWGVYLNGVSSPTLDSCLFRNLTFAPMQTSLVSYPKSTLNDSISGTTYKGIGVLAGETLSQDVTLIKKNFGGIKNIPYIFQNYTVASNAVLTIAPGVIVKFFPGTSLTVNKGLMAVGGSTTDSTIVFTDLRDDFYGGDSNADSTITAPTNYTGAPYYWSPGWNGIIFEDQSLDPLCQLTHCVIKYSGLYYYSNQAAVITNNASPTITFCSLTNNANAITANGSSNPVVNYCDIYNNAQYGINNANQSYTIDARWNWWGSNSGPTIATNPGGTGQAITASVDYSSYRVNGSLNPILGDVSLNGIVQAFDASLILKYIVNPSGDSLNAIQQSVADVSGNGTITAYDASLVLQYVVNLITGFPVEIGTSSKKFTLLTKAQFDAQKSPNASLTFPATTAVPDSLFTLPISLKNISGVSSVELTLKYDPSLAVFDTVKIADAASGMTMNYYNDKKNGLIRIAMAGSSMLQNDGDIAEILFRASKNVRGTVTSQIAVAKFLVNESDMTRLAPTAILQIIGKPTSYQLDQNYPNPFNPSTTIGYQLPDDNTHVRLVVYNITGQIVKTLFDGTQNAGSYKLVWDGTNSGGAHVSSGIYFYRIAAGKFVQVKKTILLK